MRDEIKEWWIEGLLRQQASIHPIFGVEIQVQFKDGVVTLAGQVDSADEVEELEREAASVDTVKNVVNRLTVDDHKNRYHMQTVIGVYGDRGSARLACQAASDWTLHGDDVATLLEETDTAREQLSRSAQAAHVPEDTVTELVRLVETGKALLLSRVSEDDALRVISELEGSRAEKVLTLPPEPDAMEAS